MNIQFKKLELPKLKAEFQIDDGFFLIQGKIILAKNKYMVVLPSESYQDKQGQTKYKSLVKVAGDKDRWFKFNDWVLNQAHEQNIIDLDQTISDSNFADEIPF